MSRLIVFNSVSLDGYFTDKTGDMSWAHGPEQNEDKDWNAFIHDNAKGGAGVFLFGRKTYEMMASYWPTPAAKKADPDFAEQMNNTPKIVVSKTLKEATWNNSTILRGELPAQVRKMKSEGGKDILVMGSGTVVSLLAKEGLVDEFQLTVIPLVLGAGRTMFDGLEKKVPMKRTKTREFKNGNVFSTYEPVPEGGRK